MSRTGYTGSMDEDLLYHKVVVEPALARQRAEEEAKAAAEAANLPTCALCGSKIKAHDLDHEMIDANDALVHSDCFYAQLACDFTIGHGGSRK